MLNNFIYAKSKALFEQQLEAGNVLDEAIVFIEDTKEIWNHGHYFAGEGVDVNDFNNLQTEVSQLSTDKQDKWTDVELTGSTINLSSMLEDTFYYNNTGVSSLTINSFATSGNPRNSYKIAFRALSGMTLSLPSSVYWANGIIPEIEGLHYELSIERSCGVYKAILIPFNQI